MRKENIGSSFDHWLRDEGICEEATAVAVKRLLARQLAQEMETQKLSKTEMAKRMGTSRAALDRLLDPENEAVTLQTLLSGGVGGGAADSVELGLVNTRLNYGPDVIAGRALGPELVTPPGYSGGKCIDRVTSVEADSFHVNHLFVPRYRYAWNPSSVS